MELYSPKSIANYFLELAAEKGEKLTPMKLQKLVYYAAGWFAGHTGKPLVDEAPEAWQYGPVFPSIYHEFKRFGASPITSKATQLEPNEFDFGAAVTPADTNVRKFLDNIWESYSKYTGIALSEMTHAQGSPWHQTWQASQGVRNISIPFELVRDNFKLAADKAKAKKAAAE